MDILSGLNSEQQRAVLATEGPVLILAGAGSGKTKCLTHRLAYIINSKKAQMNEILVVTFTNKAAQEMARRILNVLDMPLSDFEKNPNFTMRRTLPWVGTFHSICVRLLRGEAINIGLRPQFTILDSDDSLSIIKSILKDKNLDPKQYSPQAIRSIISNAKNELMNAAQYKPYAQGHFQEVAAEVFSSYERKLGELQALDFDDLIARTVKMLEDYPEIRAKYNKQFKYVMVDEYQDTNRSQYKLTKMLTNPATNNLCVVGDDYQSIYSFRGSDFKNILNFNRDYTNTTVIKLEQNYRSTKTILAGASAIIEKVKHRSDKKIWTDNDSGVPITLFEAHNGYGEADFVATEARSLKSMTGSYKEMAILYRTNSQSRLFEEVFLSQGIPYRLIGALRFYERREIKDVLAYLRFLINPDDTYSLSRIINTPPRGIGPKTFEKGGAKVDAFIAQMTTLRSALGGSPVTVLEMLLSRVDFRRYLDDGTEEGEARWQNVEELINLASEFEKMEDFLEHVALVSDVDNYDGNSEAVTLMTIHAAKGLEFDTVFLVGMEEGLFPHLRALDNETEMDEERRLCYVGMTRARKRLYLTNARSRIIHGGLTSSLPSRFIREIDSKLVDRV